MFYCLLDFLGICRMFLYQSICAVGFVGFLSYLVRAHLGLAMDIVLLHICILAYVLIGDSK